MRFSEIDELVARVRKALMKTKLFQLHIMEILLMYGKNLQMKIYMLILVLTRPHFIIRGQAVIIRPD